MNQGWQEMACCSFVCLFVLGLVGWCAWMFLRDMELGGGKMIGVIAVGGSMLMCVRNYWNKGYTLPEILGGRMVSAKEPQSETRGAPPLLLLTPPPLRREELDE